MYKGMHLTHNAVINNLFEPNFMLSNMKVNDNIKVTVNGYFKYLNTC